MPADGTLAAHPSATISAYPASRAARQNLADFSRLRNGSHTQRPCLKWVRLSHSPMSCSMSGLPSHCSKRPTSCTVAVGTRVTSRPPPRSVRAASPHTAPAHDAVAVGTCVSSHAPRPDPYVRLSRIRLLPRVGNGTSRRSQIDGIGIVR